MIIPVILSGGSGTRLWPLSRRATPKQFRSLVGTQTMIQDTAARLATLTEVGEPLVVCGPRHASKVQEQLAAIGVSPTILIEPSAKNTAPAVAAACLASIDRDPASVVVVLPSDHVIENVDEFARMVDLAVTTAGDGHLTTFGIVPTFPATGYGYIQPGDDLGDGARAIAAFVEKPDEKTALEYVASGYLWNAGIFVFRAADFLEELKTYAPAMHASVVAAYQSAPDEGETVHLAEEGWNSIDPLSIDYAVMEPTKRGAVLPLACGWSDVGSWATLYDLGTKDAAGNVVQGNVFLSGTENTYVRSDSKPVVLVGVEDLIVVEMDDVVLVMHRRAAEDVKALTEQLPDELT